MKSTPTIEEWATLTRKLNDVFGEAYGTDLLGKLEISGGKSVLTWSAYHDAVGRGETCNSAVEAIDKLIESGAPILLKKATRLREEAAKLEELASKVAGPKPQLQPKSV